MTMLKTIIRVISAIVGILPLTVKAQDGMVEADSTRMGRRAIYKVVAIESTCYIGAIQLDIFENHDWYWDFIVAYFSKYMATKGLKVCTKSHQTIDAVPE